MLIKTAADIRSSEITDERQYLDRRTFIRSASAALAGAAAMNFVPGAPGAGAAFAQTPIPNLKKGPFNTDEPPNKIDEITGYNNFYEFGLDKEDPARYAGKMKTRPWTVEDRRRGRQAWRLRHRRHHAACSRSRSGSTASVASRPGRW